ncbi:MAG TPA: hypothetical protein DHN33_05750 [Eubacteriaceae bacterium]|nr:hypothetical protein [Eubacteriaceae bacterium]
MKGRPFTMKLRIYRGTNEIGGTFIELKTENTKILIDAGYPLFLNNSPIDDKIEKFSYKKLLDLGVLLKIEGLYAWDKNVDFDAVVISHAHLDHYGLLKYVNSEIPLYVSAGTRKLMELTKLFVKAEGYGNQRTEVFKMYETFQIGDFEIKPDLMDHSAFDSAAFELMAENKIFIYTGDFRGHGRKGICIDRFIYQATKRADVLITEGTIFGRRNEKIMTEEELETKVVEKAKNINGPILYQSSSQNIDRIVSFYKAALRSKRIFVVDVYTANVLYELRKLGNNLPYPSIEYENIKVFYPYRITKKIFNEIGKDYAKRFSLFHISREELEKIQKKVIMMVRPSMGRDLEKSDLKDGLFLYSLWSGYRSNNYQQQFEQQLQNKNFLMDTIHTCGHADLIDIQKLIAGLDPKVVIPIHTMKPNDFLNISKRVKLLEDGVEYTV